MPNFDTALTKRDSVNQANSVLDQCVSVYRAGKHVQALLALYQSGSDPVLNAALNALFSASERSELGAMATAIGILVTTFETNHRGAIGLSP